MSKPRIELKNISKHYRMYLRPAYRIMSLLGMPVSRNHYRDFWSLQNVNLSIPSGGKLGIVGRNGAGKSTLLKIVAGQIRPTTGEVIVRGKVQALMELGTGFHPELSGYQNIIASLGYLGVTGRQAQKEAEKIADFAEIEEFINNPLRTYSAGMYARLAFSVATNIKPEILIIDEILGAGDAYFSHKAMDRMRELTAGGTTVLFVSHDMSSVQQLCDEAIWIERGQVILEADTATVAIKYADMIRKREELRLKARNSMMKMATLEEIQRKNNDKLQLIVRALPTDEPVQINKILFEIDDHHFTSVNVGSAQDSAVTEDGFILLDDTVGKWSTPKTGIDGLPFRELTLTENQSGAAVFNLPGIDPSVKNIIEFNKRGGAVILQVYDGKVYQEIARIHANQNWELFRIRIPKDIIQTFLHSLGFMQIPSEEQLEVNNDIDVKISSKPEVNIVDDQLNLTSEPTKPIKKSDCEIFSGHILLDKVEILKNNKIAYIFNTFDSLTVRISYRTLKAVHYPNFVATFHRSGIIALQSISGFTTNQLKYLPAGVTGVTELIIPQLSLGRGIYLLSIGIFPEIDRNSLDTEKTALVLQDRRYEIHVEQPEGGRIDLGISRSETLWKYDFVSEDTTTIIN